MGLIMPLKLYVGSIRAAMDKTRADIRESKERAKKLAEEMAEKKKKEEEEAKRKKYVYN